MKTRWPWEEGSISMSPSSSSFSPSTLLFLFPPSLWLSIQKNSSLPLQNRNLGLLSSLVVGDFCTLIASSHAFTLPSPLSVLLIKVEEYFEGHASICIPFTKGSGWVEGSCNNYSHAHALSN